jgi:hypothetical protein
MHLREHWCDGSKNLTAWNQTSPNTTVSDTAHPLQLLIVNKTFFFWPHWAARIITVLHRKLLGFDFRMIIWVDYCPVGCKADTSSLVVSNCKIIIISSCPEKLKKVESMPLHAQGKKRHIYLPNSLTINHTYGGWTRCYCWLPSQSMGACNLHRTVEQWKQTTRWREHKTVSVEQWKQTTRLKRTQNSSGFPAFTARTTT